MSHSFLLEIGLEEMPAKGLQSVMNELEKRIGNHFTENSLSFETIQAFSTPRRLAVYVTGLDEGQADRTESVKGPAKRIAVDDEGNWTKAAIGFTKGQKASLEESVFKEVKGEDYLFVSKHIPGKSAVEVVKELTPKLSSLPFAVSMKWGNHPYRYIRPVHWLVALLDDTVVDLSLFDVTALNESRGHRFLGDAVTLSHADDYQTALEKEWVIADRARRQDLIKEQITDLCENNSWKNPLDNQSLLEEVTDLVEYPTAFYGSFDEAFLSVPESVLETAMADHQRYFPVRRDNDTAEFLPYFIAVRNGNDQAIEQVRKGNEKVLSARLADAAFFYDEDKKVSIDAFVEKLKYVSFHEKIGSLFDKQVRLTNIAQLIAPYFEQAELNADAIERAGMMAKFDLVTQTVNEFTSLQGEIAGIFARERNESDQIADALAEQYLPKSMEGPLPQTALGAVLSLSDKLDSLLSFFAVDMIPSGSNDPFALRRQAMGIVRIIEAFNLNLSIGRLIDAINEQTESIEQKAAIAQKKEVVIQFIKDRVDQYLSLEAGLDKDHDVRKAVLTSSQDDLNTVIETAKVLAEEKSASRFKAVVESLTRVSNLAAKADSETVLSSQLFETESEKTLYEAVLKMEALLENGLTVKEKWSVLADLHPLIDDFFESNMVMADNDAIRLNRLALLNRIDSVTSDFAQFNELVIK
ncbi:MAG: glycine--tRNA ligase subunit beta [Alkalibacterium sp.]|nr:glycine--tRNA ligase subunit beta [Alkalibacterium sp.]